MDSANTPPPKNLPSFITPMAALGVTKLPVGAEWGYELKLDGYRALIIKNGEHVQIRSRNDRNLTTTYPSVVAAGKGLAAESATVDGEIVALDEAGRPSFQFLQHRGGAGKGTIVFYVFDLLHLNGADLTQRTLKERRETSGRHSRLGVDVLRRASRLGG